VRGSHERHGLNEPCSHASSGVEGHIDILGDYSETVPIGIGIAAETVVPEPLDSIFSSPLNRRSRSRVPPIPTPEPRD
jgi:hypothetical protein